MASRNLMQKITFGECESSSDREFESDSSESSGRRRACSPRERLAYDRFADAGSPDMSDDGSDPNDVLSETSNYEIRRPDDDSCRSRPHGFRKERFNMLQRNRVAVGKLVTCDDPDEQIVYARVVARPHDMLRSLRRRRHDFRRRVEKDASSDSDCSTGCVSSSPSTGCPSVTSSSDRFSDGLDSRPSSLDLAM